MPNEPKVNLTLSVMPIPQQLSVGFNPEDTVDEIVHDILEQSGGHGPNAVWRALLACASGGGPDRFQCGSAVFSLPAPPLSTAMDAQTALAIYARLAYLLNGEG